ncbi:class I SAM-dependent methyltransferase [Kouleothrix sp.]|uniref:class I SAM-dependent methyltransferase n=1 Tax=Kouleothrix sp. TaxID=2779161 RepID=UPI00391A9EDE
MQPTDERTDYLNFGLDLADPAFVSCYDELPLWSAGFGELLLRHVPLRPGISALDLGCGTGFPLLELAQRLGPGSRVYGIDPWRAALARAGRKAGLWQVAQVLCVAGDAARLPFADGQIDLIVSNLGINNFESPAAVFGECRRVCGPGATLALTTNLQGHMHELYEVFAAVLARLGLAEAQARLGRHIAHRATVESLGDQIAAARFRVARVVEQDAWLRFADGSALFRHFFIKLAFLDGWKAVVPAAQQPAVFGALEQALNAHAARQGELRLRIPMAYVEAAPM